MSGKVCKNFTLYDRVGIGIKQKAHHQLIICQQIYFSVFPFCLDWERKGKNMSREIQKLISLYYLTVFMIKLQTQYSTIKNSEQYILSELTNHLSFILYEISPFSSFNDSSWSLQTRNGLMAYMMLFYLQYFQLLLKRLPMFHLPDQSPEPSPIDPFEIPDPVPHQTNQPQPAQGMQAMYYEQYKKIYNTSYRLHGQAAKQVDKHKAISQKIALMQAQLAAFDRRKRSQEVEQMGEKTPQGLSRKERKRNRRTAQQIVRRYECPHEYCDRCYGSEGSLQQHVKLKHPELYQARQDEQEM